MRLATLSLVGLLGFGACSDSSSDQPTIIQQVDPQAEAAAQCSVTKNGDGTFTMECPDGTSVSWSDGQQGAEATPCGVTDNGNGTVTMTCPNGTNVTWNESSGAHVPGGVLYGSYVVENSLDAAFLSGVTTVTGQLTIQAPMVTAIALPSLVHVGDNLAINDNFDLVSLSLPAVQTVGRDFGFKNNVRLTSVTLGLTHVGGNIDVDTNSSLPSLALPLTKLNGDLSLGLNAMLQTFSLPATWMSGALTITDNGSLAQIALPVTTIAGPVTIKGNSSTDVVFAALTYVGGAIDINNVDEVAFPVLSAIGGNFKLQNHCASVSLPVLNSVGSFDIRYTTGMTAFTLPVLEQVGTDFQVIANEALETFSVPALDRFTYFQVGYNTALTHFALAATEGTGALSVFGNDLIEYFTAPALLSVGYLLIFNNPVLDWFDLTSLYSVPYNLNIYSNASLCNNYATAISTQVSHPSPTIYGNTGVCP